MTCPALKLPPRPCEPDTWRLRVLDDDPLADAIYRGTMLVEEARQGPTPEARDRAMIAWRAWVIEVQDFLMDPSGAGPLLTLMMTLLMNNEDRDFADVELDALLELLRRWQRQPRPEFREALRWEHLLEDVGIETHAW